MATAVLAVASFSLVAGEDGDAVPAVRPPETPATEDLLPRWRRGSPERPPPRPAIDADLVAAFGPVAHAVLAAPDRVRCYRIADREKAADDPRPAIAGYAILADHGDLLAADRQAISRLVTSIAGFPYVRHSIEGPRNRAIGRFGCGSSPGVALRFTRGGTSIDALLCFTCREWQFFTAGEAVAKRLVADYFFAFEDQLIALVRKWMPGDAAIQELAPPLVVLRSWADLWKQPAVDVGGGVLARFGIEDDTVAAGGGVLLYCLTEARPRSGEVAGEEIGPATVEVRGPEQGDGGRVALRAMLGVAELLAWRGKPLLYLRTLSFTAEGHYLVIIRDADRRALLRTQVMVKAGPVPGWMMPGQPAVRVLGDPVVHLRRGPAALPHWDGLLPAGIAPADDPLADTAEQAAVRLRPLPRLLPEHPDPNLILAGDATRLTLTADPALTLHDAQEQFLVRWWIDDRPLPAAGKEFLRDWIGSIHTNEVATVRFACDLAAIGARPGQRIGVQVLYCSNGVTPVGELALTPEAVQSSKHPPVRLSNRVDFIAP